MNRIFYIILLVTVSSLTQAQIETPRPSPIGTITQKIGLNEFSITYSRPSSKGRKVFGEIVPFDKLWRFGANMATIFKSNEDFSIQGTKIPAGEYSLFAIPGQTNWTIILNKTAKMSGTSNYKESEDQLRISVKPETLPILTETFTINFSNLKDNSGLVEIFWENTRVTFEVNVEFDAKVSKQIDEVMAGPSSGAYYSAASYYFNNGKDLNKALEWVNKALEKGEKYWILSLKAQIQAGLSNFKGAVETGTKAMNLAAAESDDAYVKLNKDRITEWTSKIPVTGPDKVKKR